MTHERSKKGLMGQVVGSLYYLDPTVIPRLKSLRSGDDPVFSFGVLFYSAQTQPRRVVQHVDDAAPFKSVFLDRCCMIWLSACVSTRRCGICAQQ